MVRRLQSEKILLIMLLLRETYLVRILCKEKKRKLTEFSLVFSYCVKTGRFPIVFGVAVALTATSFGVPLNFCISAIVFRVRKMVFNDENYLLAAKKSFSSLAQSSARIPPSTSRLWFNWLTTDRSITLPQTPPRGS